MAEIVKNGEFQVLLYLFIDILHLIYYIKFLRDNMSRMKTIFAGGAAAVALSTAAILAGSPEKPAPEEKPVSNPASSAINQNCSPEISLPDLKTPCPDPIFSESNALSLVREQEAIFSLELSNSFSFPKVMKPEDLFPRLQFPEAFTKQEFLDLKVTDNSEGNPDHFRNCLYVSKIFQQNANPEQKNIIIGGCYDELRFYWDNLAFVRDITN